jgi:hypothetical protein
MMGILLIMNWVWRANNSSKKSEDLSLRSASLPTESVKPASLSPSENHFEPKSETPMDPPTKEFNRTLNFKMRDQELHTEWLKLMTSLQSAPRSIWDQEMNSFETKNLRNLLKLKEAGWLEWYRLRYVYPELPADNFISDPKVTFVNTAIERFLKEEQLGILASNTENQKKEWPIKRKQLLRQLDNLARNTQSPLPASIIKLLDLPE